jgi:hypothetical protein
MKSLRKHAVAAAILLAPFGAAFVAQPAVAQTYQYRVANSDQGTITGMSLNSNSGLAPGAMLRVQVYATPGARWANVSLGDSGVRVPLHERAAGEYVGTHVIARGEHIDAHGLMTARAGWGEGPVALAFNFPPSFQSLAMGAGPAAGPVAVNEFRMWPRDDFGPGDVIHFRVEGTPHSRAWVQVPEIARGIPLREVRPGVYMGNYTIRRHDDLDEFGRAQATLRHGDDRVMANLGEGREVGYNR